MFRDILEHANGLDEWQNNDYHQLGSRTDFCGNIADCIYDHFARVTFERIHTPLVEQVGSIPSSKVLVLHLESESDVLLNGRFLNTGTFHFSSSKRIHAVARSPMRACILTFDRDFFFHHIAGQPEQPAFRGPFERVVTPEMPTFQRFGDLVSGRFSQVLEGGSIQADLPALSGCLREVWQTGLRPTSELQSSTRAYIVDRSCELLLRNFENEDYGVPDICDSLRISRRTLQYSFDSVVGLSPSNYIRAIRLNIARKTLITSPREKVQGAALHAGFSHLGRFSRYYQDFFGELPSDTAYRSMIAVSAIAQHDLIYQPSRF
jgi:AraC family transcriptional regulator, ethanolamine operon transcriptional activator